METHEKDNEIAETVKTEQDSTESEVIAKGTLSDETEDEDVELFGKFKELLRKFLEPRPGWVTTFYIISFVVFISALPIAYLLWFKAIPSVYEITKSSWGHWLWAWLVLIILAFVPIYIVMAGNWLLRILLSITVDKTVKEAFDPVRDAEKALSEGDEEAKLLPLLKYSRSQLEAYYIISLKQTRRSFLFSVIAMWLGFILIIAGISVYFLPIEDWGLKRPDADIKFVVIAGGAIIEFISALFLWVYRSTTNQLTYFYNRQIHTHNVILGFRIASTMSNSSTRSNSDDAKRSIIDKMLEAKWDATQPPPTRGKGIGKLIS
jgi:hypothetical protein